MSYENFLPGEKIWSLLVNAKDGSWQPIGTAPKTSKLIWLACPKTSGSHTVWDLCVGRYGVEKVTLVTPSGFMVTRLRKGWVKQDRDKDGTLIFIDPTFWKPTTK